MGTLVKERQILYKANIRIENLPNHLSVEYETDFEVCSTDLYDHEGRWTSKVPIVTIKKHSNHHLLQVVPVPKIWPRWTHCYGDWLYIWCKTIVGNDTQISYEHDMAIPRLDNDTWAGRGIQEPKGRCQSIQRYAYCRQGNVPKAVDYCNPLWHLIPYAPGRFEMWVVRIRW